MSFPTTSLSNVIFRTAVQHYKISTDSASRGFSAVAELLIRLGVVLDPVFAAIQGK